MDTQQTIKEIIESIEKKADVKAVFGDSVKQGDLTIIPVGKISSMGGGGMGNKNGDGEGKGKGFGMGYNIKSQPVGYIEIRGEEARFVDIIDKTKFVAAGVALMFPALWVLGKIIGRRKIKEW